MKSVKHPKLRKNVLWFENTDSAGILYDSNSAIQFELDEDLLEVVRCLDGKADPYAIPGFSREEVADAIAELEHYGLLEQPALSVQKFLQFIRHPLMICIPIIGVMACIYSTESRALFYSSAIFLCIILLGYVGSDIREN